MKRDPLTPEERELARWLATASDDVPSPEIDARILAAARAAAASGGAAPVAPPLSGRPSLRRRRRWPAAWGLAASVTLAVGVAWQLRQPQPAPVVETTAPARTDAAAGRPAAAEPAPPASGQDSAPADAGRARAVAEKPRPMARAAAAPASRPPAPPVPAAAARSAMPSPPPPPLPPAAPAAPAASAPSASLEEAASARAPEADAYGAREAAPVAAPQAAADLAERDTGDALGAAPAHDAQHWLQRIREQRDRGDLEGARASLARFVRSHPRHPLPDDLRPLLPVAP